MGVLTANIDATPNHQQSKSMLRNASFQDKLGIEPESRKRTNSGELIGPPQNITLARNEDSVRSLTQEFEEIAIDISN